MGAVALQAHEGGDHHLWTLIVARAGDGVANRPQTFLGIGAIDRDAAHAIGFGAADQILAGE